MAGSAVCGSHWICRPSAPTWTCLKSIVARPTKASGVVLGKGPITVQSRTGSNRARTRSSERRRRPGDRPAPRSPIPARPTHCLGSPARQTRPRDEARIVILDCRQVHTQGPNVGKPAEDLDRQESVGRVGILCDRQQPGDRRAKSQRCDSRHRRATDLSGLVVEPIQHRAAECRPVAIS